MTWLQGVTTWGALCGRLTEVACGEAPDDLAVTCAVGDRWVRDISTSFDLIRTPISKNVNTGTMYQKAGYFSLMSYNEALSTAGTYSWQKGVCKITTAFSGVPTVAGPNGRWLMFVQVHQVNTTPFNYSTASVRVQCVNDDNTLLNGQNITLNSSGSATINYAGVATRTVTINVTDPSGTLVNNAQWMRGFTNTYLGGIDWFGPSYYRRTANPTFTVDPPGLAGTDWDKNVDISTPWLAYTTTQVGPFGTSVANPSPQGGPFSGVGYKTSAGLTGAQYACSWDMALSKIRLWADTAANNGRVNLDYNCNGADDAGTYRRIGGYTATAWMRPFFTPGSVESTSQIQWWMSVKADKLMIVLNADPGYSGLLTFNGVWSFTPIDYFGGGYDKFPIVYGKVPTTQGNVQSTAAQPFIYQAMTYWTQKLRQDGSESRDWQTGWMRSDLYWNSSNTTNGSTGNNIGMASLSFNGVSQAYHTPGLIDSQIGQTGFGDVFMPLNAIKPNPITGKWRMFTHAIADKPLNASGSVSSGWGLYSSFAEEDTPRGYVAATVDAPFLIVPGYANVGTGFGSGDELTDTVSGRKWFMVKADNIFIGSYCGLLGQFYNALAAVNIPGYAILEN